MNLSYRVSDATFIQEVLEAELPVLVEFWSSWCPPCKMMEPVIEQLAVEYAGRLKVCRLNADQNPRSTERYGIQGVPTCAVFQSGVLEERRVGAQSKGQLVQMLNGVLDP